MSARICGGHSSEEIFQASPRTENSDAASRSGVRGRVQDFVLNRCLGTRESRAFVYSAKRVIMKVDYGGEEVLFKNEEGLCLEGMYFDVECYPKREGINPTGVTVLFCMGSHHSFELYAYRMVETMLKEGHNVFTFNYRGFGKSQGKPTEEGLYTDTEAAYQFLTRVKQVHHVVVYGYSLGSAPAIDLAMHHPIKLVLDRPLASMDRVVKNVSPYAPVQNLFRKFAHFDNLSKINKVQREIFFIVGARDRIMERRIKQGEMLYGEAQKRRSVETIFRMIPIDHWNHFESGNGDRTISSVLRELQEFF